VLSRSLPPAASLSFSSQRFYKELSVHPLQQVHSCARHLFKDLPVSNAHQTSMESGAEALVPSFLKRVYHRGRRVFHNGPQFMIAFAIPGFRLNLFTSSCEPCTLGTFSSSFGVNQESALRRGFAECTRTDEFDRSQRQRCFFLSAFEGDPNPAELFERIIRSISTPAVVKVGAFLQV